MNALRGLASVAAIAAASALPGCAAPERHPHSLAGTSWQLVSIQSMSDDQGTVRPDDPTRYAMSFDTDGRATLRLDCNRALGAYKATPSSEGTSGELSFEPLAATRATCGPGSLEPRLVKALPNVRSYLVKDGRLHLSLMADGGLLTWMPAR